MGDLLKRLGLLKALDYASGTATRNGAVCDMQGYDGVIMICLLATIAAGAVSSLKAQQDTAVGMGTAADLLGTGIAIADDDDDQIVAIDLYRPRERYVRAVVVKDASNACAETVLYLRYKGRKLPKALSVTDLVTAELHVSPIEGTA